MDTMVMLSMLGLISDQSTQLCYGLLEDVKQLSRRMVRALRYVDDKSTQRRRNVL